MKRAILGLSLLLTISTAGAQTETKKNKVLPDLSGTWVLDEAKSNTGSGKDRITDYELTIVSKGPEIRMSKRFKQGGREFVDEVVYFTDGRPEYSSRAGRVDSAPVTRWQGKKLVRRTGTPPLLDGATNRSGISFTIVTTEEWELSKNNETLTRTVLTTSGVMLALRYKYVFTRKS